MKILKIKNFMVIAAAIGLFLRLCRPMCGKAVPFRAARH